MPRPTTWSSATPCHPPLATISESQSSLGKELNPQPPRKRYKMDTGINLSNTLSTIICSYVNKHDTAYLFMPQFSWKTVPSINMVLVDTYWNHSPNGCAPGPSGLHPPSHLCEAVEWPPVLAKPQLPDNCWWDSIFGPTPSLWCHPPHWWKEEWSSSSHCCRKCCVNWARVP